MSMRLATPKIRNRPNTVSESTASNTELREFLALTELWAENSVSSSQPVICVQKRTHRVCRRTQWVLSSETLPSKQYSSRFLKERICLSRKETRVFLRGVCKIGDLLALQSPCCVREGRGIPHAHERYNVCGQSADVDLKGLQSGFGANFLIWPCQF